MQPSTTLLFPQDKYWFVQEKQLFLSLMKGGTGPFPPSRIQSTFSFFAPCLTLRTPPSYPSPHLQGSARDFAIPGDVHHKYNDKFALAETQLSSLVACSLQGTQTLGLTAEQVTSLSAWARDGSEVTLRFSFTTGFTFIRESLPPPST